MAFGDIAKIFNGNNVLFDMDDITPTLQEIILCHRFRNQKVLPINRSNSRAGPVETPAFVQRDIHINADMTKDLYDRLEVISEPTVRGGFNQINFKMRAQAISSAPDDSTLTFQGYCWSVDNVAVEDDKFIVDFIIRVVNSTVVIT